MTTEILNVSQNVLPNTPGFPKKIHSYTAQSTLNSKSKVVFIAYNQKAHVARTYPLKLRIRWPESQNW